MLTVAITMLCYCLVWIMDLSVVPYMVKYIIKSTATFYYAYLTNVYVTIPWSSKGLYFITYKEGAFKCCVDKVSNFNIPITCYISILPTNCRCFHIIGARCWVPWLITVLVGVEFTSSTIFQYIICLCNHTMCSIICFRKHLDVYLSNIAGLPSKWDWIVLLSAVISGHYVMAWLKTDAV